MKYPENDELFHVEHSEYSMFKYLRLVVLAVLLLTPGCKSHNPEPENLDPIYNDLDKELVKATQALEVVNKKIEDLTNEYQKTEVRTIDRKSVARDRATSQEVVRKIQQQVEYYRIAKVKRKHEARTTYERAFAEEKPWPDKKEVEDYFHSKKMLAVSRNWNLRVPKPPNPINSVKMSGDTQEAKANPEDESP